MVTVTGPCLSGARIWPILGAVMFIELGEFNVGTSTCSVGLRAYDV